jgi:hypothetical protein
VRQRIPAQIGTVTAETPGTTEGNACGGQYFRFLTHDRTQTGRHLECTTQWPACAWERSSSFSSSCARG